jgi:hypothetical protein
VATLREANNTEVHGLDLDTPGALERLRTLAPYAVVLDPQELEGESLAEFLGLIESCPLACVVSLRWGEDVVDILRKERIEVAKARDLLAAIVGPHENGPGD